MIERLLIWNTNFFNNKNQETLKELDDNKIDIVQCKKPKRKGKAACYTTNTEWFTEEWKRIRKQKKVLLWQ